MVGDGPAQLVTVNHVVMSASMIVTAWWAGGLTSAVVQVVAFAVFTACWVVVAIGTASVVSRIGAATHAGLNLAMIWMATMPLTKPGMPGMTDGGGHAAHHHDDAPTTSAMDPVSMSSQLGLTSVLTAVSIGLCVAALLWWLSRLCTAPDAPLPARTCS